MLSFPKKSVAATSRVSSCTLHWNVICPAQALSVKQHKNTALTSSNVSTAGSYFPSFFSPRVGEMRRFGTVRHLCIFAVTIGLLSIKNVNWNFFFFFKYHITSPPPPVTGCQNAIFQIRLYLDNLLNCNMFSASRHITIGTSLLNKSDTEPSLCRRAPDKRSTPCK